MFDIFKIFSNLKKTFKKNDLFLSFLLIITYFVTRLTNITIQPIFSDEGIYIHWAKVAWHDAAWRFVSLTDGKQPLQTWLTIPFLKLFPDNALLAGRLFAVFGGIISLVGVFLLLNYIFDKKTAFWGSFIYVLTPYFLFYDRMALVDSYVNAAVIWILFLSIILIKERRLDTALILGFAGGMFLLAKSSVQIFIMLSVFAPILILKKNKKEFFSETINYYILFGISAVIAFLIYNIQRLSPFLHYVAEKNLTFVMSFSEFLKTPFQYFPHNITAVPWYVASESAILLSLLGLIGLTFLLKKNTKLGLYILAWIILPYIAVDFFSKILFPRYVIFLGSLLLITASALFYYIKDIKIKIFIFLAFLISVSFFNYTILFQPAKIPFPEVDRGQYLEGWPAGWGVKEFMDYAREQSKEKPVVIIAEGNFGMASDVLDVFLKRNDKITIKGYWPLGEEQLRENLPLLKDNKVYVFFSHQENFPDSWPLKLFKVITKPGNQSDFHIFELVDTR